jgi:hypothetical protein
MSFETARTLLSTGDLSSLAVLLDEHPGLTAARAPNDDPPYDGYFNGATLLHHVAGNPLIEPIPDTVLAGARLLIERGAEVDAVTRAGPSQPNDIGWTTLGLAATSAALRRAGAQAALIDLLAAAGADLDARNGGAVMGALYYGETHAARHLADRGCRLDLIAAAGVGDLDRVATELERSDEDLAAAPRLAHYSRIPWPAHGSPHAAAIDIRGMALVHSALHGRLEAMRLLLDAGCDPDHRPPFEHGGTALHWAVMGDRPGAVRLLLAHGADPHARDAEFDSTPAGWAEHLGRPAATEALSGP